MGTTADKLNKVLETKSRIREAIAEKGVDIDEGTIFADYPDLIRNIEGGNPVYEDFYNIKTDNGTNYRQLFEGYSGSTLDVSSLDTSNVTDMWRMFANCYYLQSLDVSGWDTNRVENLCSIFNSCTQLRELDLSSWSTNNVREMNEMFYSCHGLTTLDLSSWSINNVNNMEYMFCYCSNLMSLDISNFDMNNVENTDYMFGGCNSLHTLRLDNCSRDTIDKIINSADFPTDDIGVTRTIYCKGENLITALEAPTNWVFEYIDGVIPEEPEEPEVHPYILGEFRDNSEITEVETIVTSEHDNLSEMFSGCNNLVSVNTKDWDTSNVTNMNSMFSECHSLTELDLSNWDTGNVREMNEMFNNCRELRTLNVSNWDTDNVEYMSNMFRGCERLTELDLSSFNTGNVREMRKMFNSCNELISLDIRNFDMSNIEDEWVTERMFGSCERLHILRLDNCSNDTISKIINSSEFPTNETWGVEIEIDGEMIRIETRTIYCREENADGLEVPENWEFSYVEEGEEDSCEYCGLHPDECTCVPCEYCGSYDCDGSCQEEPSEE